MFLQETVFEEKILVCLCTEDAFLFYRLQNPFFFSLYFYFIQKCTEMIPEKGHKNQN